MITPGTPEKVKPSTLYPQLQCNPIWYQMPGIDGDRCGSLASNGFPVVVSDPEMTNELEPSPGRFEPDRPGRSAMVAESWRSTGATAVRSCPVTPESTIRAAGVAGVVVLKTPSVTVPGSTIGRFFSKGYAG